MPERLSPADMSSAVAERGPIHVHVGPTTIMDGEPPSFDLLLEHVDARLDLMHRARPPGRVRARCRRSRTRAGTAARSTAALTEQTAA